MMNGKTFLAGVAATVVLASACIPAFAEYGNGLQLSSDPAYGTNTSTSTTTNSGYGTEDVQLRGRVSALPKGTMMMIKLDQPINSASAKQGEPITAIVEADVSNQGQVVIPAGSQLEGSLATVSSAAHLGKPGSVALQFHVVKTPYGSAIPIRSHLVTADNSGVLRGDSVQAQVLKTGGSAVGIAGAGTLMGTAAGSLIGSAAGGAAFGLGAGALAGIGYAVVRQGKEVSLPEGARMSIVLDQPLAVN